MTDIKSMTVDELKELVTALGDKPFRAKQIYSWLHEHLVTSWDEMTNLSRGLREKLKEYPVTALEVVDVQTSRLDGTQKYLFRLSDGNVIESVLMRYKHGNSVCISSQVGCRMGCRCLQRPRLWRRWAGCRRCLYRRAAAACRYSRGTSCRRSPCGSCGWRHWE